MNSFLEKPIAESLENPVVEKKLKELFDGLAMENLFALQDHSQLSRTLDASISIDNFLLNPGEHYCSYKLQKNGLLIARVTAEVDVQAFRLSRGPFILFYPSCEITRIDDALDLMKCLVQCGPEDVRPDISGLDDFMQNLALSQAQSSWAAEYSELIIANCQQDEVALHAWEQLCALRDRPFHPLAKSKKGWSAENFRQYSAETSTGFGLSWVAVNNRYLTGNLGLRGSAIAMQLLAEPEQAMLLGACKNISVDCNHYTLVPVHPWHFHLHLKKEFQSLIDAGQIILVAESLGKFNPTASGRSLIPAEQSLTHAKLPLALLCLGALRILPSRYLFNGYQAQKMLAAVIAKMPENNRQQFLLCDESQWLAFLPEGESALSNRSGFLSCLLRVYPEWQNNQSAHAALIPMAAFAVEVKGRVPAIEWLHRHGDSTKPVAEFSLTIFNAIAKLLCKLSFHCFGVGLMPEVHGQNILVGFNSTTAEQLTLRDHDTLRIFSPWLQQQQIPLQEYQMDWSTPNSLICLSPQQLLSYFLTLGVQVNLRSIADALSQAYGIPMAVFWSELKHVIESLLNEMSIPVMAKAILRKEILDNHYWPARHILQPCLVKRSRMMGMPSGVGTVINPFQFLDERTH